MTWSRESEIYAFFKNVLHFQAHSNKSYLPLATHQQFMYAPYLGFRPIAVSIEDLASLHHITLFQGVTSMTVQQPSPITFTLHAPSIQALTRTVRIERSQSATYRIYGPITDSLICVDLNFPSQAPANTVTIQEPHAA